MKKTLLALVLIAVALLPLAHAADDEPWWNQDYAYRKLVTISVSSGSAAAGYQVLLNVKHSNGMKTDFSDLRFVSGNGAELPYWIESKTDGGSAAVWVKVDNAITTTPYAAYLYYGNSAAASKSDGTATFDFFDDFSDGNYADKWTLETGYWKEANGYLQQDDTKSAWDASKLFAKNKVDVNGGSFWMQSDEYTVSSGDCEGNVNTYLYSGGSVVYGHTLRGYGGNGRVQLQYPRQKRWDAAGGVVLDTWYRIRTAYDAVNGVTLKAIDLKNGREIFSGQKTDYSPQEGQYDLALTACSSGPRYDNVIIGKYTYPEPTASFGEAEKLRPPAPAEGLVGYWPFDEKTGFVTKDESANTNDASIKSDAAWTNGVSGGALMFNGKKDSYAIIPASTVYSNEKSFSISAWYYPTEIKTDAWRIIIATGLGSGTHHQIQAAGKDSSNFNFNSELNYAKSNVEAAVKQVPNHWYHLVAVYDAEKKIKKIYVNRQLAGQDPKEVKSATGDYYIGWGHEWAQPLIGKVDELRFYDRALNENEVATLYLHDTPDEVVAQQTPQPTQAPTQQPAAATQACTPNEKRCYAGSVQRCSVDGSAWREFNTCENGCAVIEGTPACKPQTQADKPKEQATSSQNNLVTWIVVGVILLAAIAAIIYFLTRKKPEAAPSLQNQPSQPSYNTPPAPPQNFQ